MEVLRFYLLAGLLLHKAVWEVLKRRQSTAGRSPQSLSVRLIKAAKVGILGAVLVQTVAGAEVVPISADPAGLQVFGVCLYSIGLLVALLGRIQLGNNWSDIETAGVLKGQAVVSHGLFRYVRHPIYTGDLLLLLGLELALNSWGVVLVAAMAPLVLRQAIKEERRLARALPGYERYCRRTKRFLPFLV